MPDSISIAASRGMTRGSAAARNTLACLRAVLPAILLIAMLVAPGNASMERRSLNQLVGDSSLIVVGSVTGVRCEKVDEHILTRVSVTLADSSRECDGRPMREGG
jgi:hypothetical protein